ncbi:uncharacterized protein LOC131928200 isoform X1 [Physella acuta]|uniref:uncharacterized protein LOC131928200 isoform X1 n=1 Tax=Physella acuta TaxID=109671 RepID=UPI0027DD0F80|nr:uncharacterized protein LOC131928200 isoform X1 [Physella acuta]
MALIKIKAKRNRERQREYMNVNSLEILLDAKIKKRSQQWCRACMSETCLLDQGQSHQSVEDNFKETLEAVKQKRMVLENYMGHVEKLNAYCHLGMLRQPYLKHQNFLPPWLIGVLEHEISLPLVPTFPCTEEALREIHLHLCLEQRNEELLQEYISAASCVRRIRIGVARTSTKRRTKLESCLKLPVLFVKEETSDMSSLTESKQLLSKAEHQNESTSKEKNSVSNSIFLDNPLQCIEQHLEWAEVFKCTDARVSECRDERVLISGTFLTEDEGPGIVKHLPFKIIMFPGERTGPLSMRMKGTFFRSSVKSSYDLRWRYDVDIPTANNN